MAYTDNLVDIEYVGGPYDGQFAHVELDANGQPPEFPTTQQIGPIDWKADPAAGPAADIITQLYELDSRHTADGVVWVYLFTGETSMGLRSAA